MDLFDQVNNAPRNLLPCDGTVHYLGVILSGADATQYYHTLRHEIPWRQDEVRLFGKTIFTKRKVAWYADEPVSYTYSNTTKTALPWTDTLLALKALVQAVSGETFNACLLNLYHDGREGMAWHSDAERDLKKNGAIGSLSLGAVRHFSFKHKQSQQTVSHLLEHGSLLIIKGTTQSHWLHRLPPTTTVHAPRINLTFRTIVKPPV